MKTTFLFLSLIIAYSAFSQQTDYDKKKVAIEKKSKEFKDKGNYESAANVLKELEVLKPDQSADYYFKIGELYYLASSYSIAGFYLEKYKAKTGSIPEWGIKCKEYLRKMPCDTSVSVSMMVEAKDGPITDQIFESFACEQKAAFPGGDTMLIKYIEEHKKYPEIAKENGVAGTVYIRFVITKKGEIGPASVMRAVDPLLEEEAIRVVKSFPKWNPAIKDGKPVNSWFIIPVKFKLD